MKTTTPIYTVKQLRPGDLDEPGMDDFLSESGVQINYLYGNLYQWGYFPVDAIVSDHVFLVCYRKHRKVGMLIATFSPSMFDPTIKVLQQRILYAEPGTFAAYHLLREFIDIGKRRADHVITMIGGATRIKPRTLLALGFKELETLYRLET